MKKLLSSFVLLAIVFGGYQTYAASCTDSICGNGDLCSDAAGCYCDGTLIAQNQTCSIGVGAKDTVLSSIGYSQTCSDADGCTCVTPQGPTTVTPGNVCTWDISLPQLSAGVVSVSNNVATFTFNSTKAGVISYQGSCGNGSTSLAIVGTNTTTFTLANGTYSNCSIKVTDIFNNISASFSIPSFVVNYIPGSNGGGGSSGGGSSAGGYSSCIVSDLVCINGVYKIKSGYSCAGGLLDKACGIGTGIYTGLDTTLTTLISKITGFTYSGFVDLIATTKTTKYSISREFSIQGVKVKIYTPKYTNRSIRKVANTLTSLLVKTITKKLKIVNDPNYIIDNYETISVDTKFVLYKEIGAMTKLYNEFLASLYWVLDMKKANLLPITQYYLTKYFADYNTFAK